MRDLDIRHEVVLTADDLSGIVRDHIFRRFKLPDETSWNVRFGENGCCFWWTIPEASRSNPNAEANPDA